MLSAAELAAMRTVEQSAMSSTAVIRRPTNTPDSTGSFTETLAAIGTVTCDVWAVSQTLNEAIGGAQILSRGEWYITVPYGTDVKATDVINVGSKSYEVTFVPNGASWQTALRVEANSYNEEQRN